MLLKGVYKYAGDEESNSVCICIDCVMLQKYPLNGIDSLDIVALYI